jgi:hypothetical protein
LDRSVSASGPSPAELSALIGVPLPDPPAYTLTLDLERDGPRLVLKDLDARVGDSDLDGRIAVDFANEPADVAIDLSSDWLDIATLAVDTVDTLFVGGGDIDLDRERLNLVIEARPKDQSLPAFSSPLRLQGPLTDSALDLVSAELLARGALAVGLVAAQPLAALLPLIEPGGGAGSPYCDGLMEAMRSARREARR